MVQLTLPDISKLNLSLPSLPSLQSFPSIPKFDLSNILGSISDKIKSFGFDISPNVFIIIAIILLFIILK